jgi:hypothetical protein
MHELTVRLIQFGTSPRRDALARIVDGDPSIDQIAECNVSETLGENAGAITQAAMHRFEDFHFVNLDDDTMSDCQSSLP